MALISFGFIPVVGFDASPCEVLGFEDIVIGGGDTFDCYSESENVTILPLAGTEFDGGWCFEEGPGQAIGDDFETYNLGDAENQVMLAGEGFTDPWSGLYDLPVTVATNAVVEGDYRYIRLLITANNGDVNFGGVLEFELREEIGGDNVATGGTASASATQTTFHAGLAFDGSLTSSDGWIFPAGSLPVWLQYDFGDGITRRIVEYRVGSYSTTSTTAARSSRLWKLQGSNDETTWTDLHEVDVSASMERWVFGEMRPLPLPGF